MMKFLAVFAPSQDKKDRFFSTTPTSIAWALAPLIRMIDEDGIKGIEYVEKIYDPLWVYDGIWDDFKKLLAKEQPGILLLSSTYDSHYSAVLMARIAKQYDPEITIFYGGPHVDEVIAKNVLTVMPQVYPFNECNSPFDVLISGNAELVLCQLIFDLARCENREYFFSYLSSGVAKDKYATIPGGVVIHFRSNDGRINFLFSSPNSIDLNLLPFIPRKMFGNDFDLYGFSCFCEEEPNGQISLLPSVSTMLHRGCKNFCIFCSERGGYNARSFGHILSELEMLKSQGIKGVFFDDSTFSDHEDMTQLLSELGNIGLKYASLNRFDRLQDLDMVRLLAKSGFVYQYCSIEQFDDLTLAQNGKRQKIKAIEKGVRNLKECGISLGTSLLFGMRGETDKSVKTTLEYIADLVDDGPLVAVSMSLYSFHPDTPFTLGTERGRKIQSLLHFDCPPPNPGFPWDCFEEGQWYHPSWISENKVFSIWERANTMFGDRLVRNMNKNRTRRKEINV